MYIFRLVMCEVGAGRREFQDQVQSVQIANDFITKCCFIAHWELSDFDMQQAMIAPQKETHGLLWWNHENILKTVHSLTQT